jgi:hypothetical protein
MTVTRVRRVINPRRATAKKKRKLSPKQIKIFGTKAQKAALKRKRTMARAKNPKKSAISKAYRSRGGTSASKSLRAYRKIHHAKVLADRKANLRKRRLAKKNPASVITLGLINPQPKGKKVATKTKRRRRRTAVKAVNPRRRRRSNPVARRRRSYTHRANPRRRARRNSTRVYVMPRRNGRRLAGRRNPEMFGLRGAQMGKAILAGLVGVYATKLVTPMVANAVPSVGASPIISAIISAVVAWGGGMLVSRWDKAAGEGFMFGGLMQAWSSLLNLVVPANPLSLSGLGDFAPAMFAVPENPILRAARQRALAAQAVPAGSPAMSGLAAVWQ